MWESSIHQPWLDNNNQSHAKKKTHLQYKELYDLAFFLLNLAAIFYLNDTAPVIRLLVVSSDASMNKCITHAFI